MKTGLWFLAILALMVLTTALGVVYSQHQSRSLFVTQQSQADKIDALNIHWGRLLLELNTWAAHGRVESIARESLGMRIPNTAEVELVRQ